MTSKISSAGQMKADCAFQKSNLTEALNVQKALPTLCGTHQRSKILEKLECLVNEWVKEMLTSKNMSGTCYAKVYTFGSYRLGVYLEDSDMDIICVLCMYVCILRV